MLGGNDGAAFSLSTARTPSGSIETPTGKGAGDENFPVGSFLIPAELRPHVATFYALARATDDIADNPALSPDQKIERLDRFEQALNGEEAGDPALEKAHAVLRSSAVSGVPVRHSIDLIHAFKQDAVKRRYENWDELMGYCALSAAPVGRFLLDLHGESRTKYRYSDPLCAALQVLNHLQDAQDDYRALDRVYLPGDWMAAEGAAIEDLDGAAATPGLRRVIDRCLDGCDDLLAEARLLPGGLDHRRLAMESAVIVRLAERLTRRLRRGDPVARRVALTRLDFLFCGVRGAVAGLLR